MKRTVAPFAVLYVLKVLSKGLSVFYFVLLPVFYAEGLITAAQIGYVGAAFIAALILGAFAVARWLHARDSRDLLRISSTAVILSTGLLLLGALRDSQTIIIVSYLITGVVAGLVGPSVDAVMGALTTRGDRFTSIAKISATTDVVRIVFPVLVAGAVAIGASELAIALILVAVVTLLVFATLLPNNLHPPEPKHSGASVRLRDNKMFHYILSLEFLDSFSSSQLFVFLPLLFIAKGYSLENSLVLQAAIFLGYLTGRLVLGSMAKRYSGSQSVAYAEIGMAACIMLLVVVDPLALLYVLSFFLGIFARGTSPVIKALTFDSLDDRQMRRGTAAYVVIGDSGSALAQLLFGLFIVWFGVHSPFYVAAAIAGLVAVTLLAKPIKL